MKNFIFAFLFVILSVLNSYSQAPKIEWAKCYGGSYNDVAHSIIQTSDGGYVVAGSSDSKDSQVTGNYGGHDYWVVKLDSKGAIQWQRCYGGSNYDYATSIIQTSDGGYAVVGNTSSKDSQVTGNHGSEDYWVIKLDNKGTIQWERCYGGSDNDFVYSIIQASDGGFAVAGNTSSKDSQVTGNHGAKDYWVVKLDSKGAIQWQHCYGGSYYEEANSIIQTSDGGFAVAGCTSSKDNQVTGNHGDFDYWVIKLDSIGSLQWRHCYGGSNYDEATSIIQTSDGGFALAGYTDSNDSQVKGNHGGGWDYWVVKLDNKGTLQWQHCYGGSGQEKASSIIQTSEGGYAVAGYTQSKDTQVTGNHGGWDYWVVKLDNKGTIQWERCYGGSGDDVATSIIQTSDGAFAVAGYTLSNDNQVTGNHGGGGDYWVVKLSKVITGIET